MTNGHETEIARHEATIHGSIELAAARLATEVSFYLDQMRRVGVRKQKEVAELLGVSESRVSQVLGGHGNVTIAALGKYSRALGYRVQVSFEPVESDALALRRPGRRYARQIQQGKNYWLTQDWLLPERGVTAAVASRGSVQICVATT